MTGKVRSNELKAGSFVFWLNVVRVFSFSLILFCSTLLTGCKSPQTANVQNPPIEKRKEDLLKIIDRKFENPQAHYELGQIYQSERQWIKAEYHYNTALNFDPALSEAQASTVKVFLESGDTAKSKTYADIYMSKASNSATASFRLGLAFQKQLLDEYAFDCYMQALHLAPTSAKIHRQLGYYYLSKKDMVRAEEYLKRSFQLDPDQPEVAGELGRLGVEVKIPRKAERQTRKVDSIAEQAGKEKGT
ncbi:MAG: hypothetical protein JW837_05680 [Sedimentisphaerales bacterium]|nr:hypothetical protein [Sedimentisphaerales bacterium]